MNDDERDHVVSRALRDIKVPDHERDFWLRLDQRLAAVDSPVVVAGEEPAADPDGAAPVVPLHRQPGHPAEHRPWRGRLLAVAAVLLVMVAAAGLLVADRDDTTELDTAVPGPQTSDAPGTTEPAPPTPNTGPPTTESPPTTDRQVDQPSTAAVRAWIDAIARGDTDAAALLTGERSRAYVEALGGNLEGMLIESQEGWGAWADVSPFGATGVPLGLLDGQEVTIVVFYGDYTGEGEDGYQVRALPTVKADDGSWLVEPFAFDPETGGRLEFVSPDLEQGGPLVPGEPVDVRAPGSGTFYFWLQNSGLVTIEGEEVSPGVVRGVWQPPADAFFPDLFMVAYVDGDTISVFGANFDLDAPD